MDNLHKTWPETSAIILSIIGFLFAISTLNSPATFYMLIFLWGLIFGRLWYRLKNKFKFPWVITIMGFLLGFILAGFMKGYNSILSVMLLFFLFIGGSVLSYHIHNAKIIRSREY